MDLRCKVKDCPEPPKRIAELPGIRGHIVLCSRHYGVLAGRIKEAWFGMAG